MTGEHLDWDNLRYFLAVARAGKLTAAARRLGQDHTTVGRRIASLESAFHSKLFERRPDGYRLTEAGQRLYENVQTLESSVWEIQRDLVGQTQHVEGVVRIGAPDDFGNLFLAYRRTAEPSSGPENRIDHSALHAKRIKAGSRHFDRR
jgi:DNA-binding transcriptional LysR family regulator